MMSLIVVLIVFGVALYLVSLIPMDPAILTIIRVVVILCIVLYIVSAFGLLTGLPVIRLR